MKIVSAKEIKNIDRLAQTKYHIPGIVLMENAGRASAGIIQKRFGDLSNKKIVIFAGSGNNGGDGLCLARQLNLRFSSKIRIALLSSQKKFKNEAKINLDIVKKIPLDITIIPSLKNLSKVKKILKESDLVIDAIFGIGFNGLMPELHQNIIRLINKTRVPVIALDMPSGVNADTGQIESEAVKASLTITMELPKPGLFLPPGLDFTGKLEIAKLGYPYALTENNKISINFLQKEDIRSIMPVWPLSTHKGSRGKVLVIAGSQNYIGAPFLSAQAALKSGAGLVNLAIPESIYYPLSRKVKEIIIHSLPETKNKSLGLLSAEKILKLAENSDAVLLGPGMSQDNETKTLIKKLIGDIKKPLVIDADGLNALSDDLSILKNRKHPTILTPHPGEMSRLIKTNTSEIQKDRLKFSRNFAIKNRVYLLLKGAYSLITVPKGEIFINSTGNPGMAQAGMGDVLAGMVVSLLCQNLKACEALKIGCYLHGMTGDILAEKKGLTGFTASDVVNHIWKAIKKSAIRKQ